MSKLGMGVMINLLSGMDRDTSNAIQHFLGRKIAAITLDSDTNVLMISFTDVPEALELWDAGQSCCEHRYMTTDDDLSKFAGDTLIDIETAEAPSIVDNDSSEEHDVQFLKVRTNRGVLTVETHNEHNGYYGGFSMQARMVK